MDKGQPNFLHLRAIGDKGPIIFTDKAFLQIRASHTWLWLLLGNLRYIARFPLPELTARVNGPSWRVTGFHYPSTRAVLTGVRFHYPSWRPELTGRVNWRFSVGSLSVISYFPVYCVAYVDRCVSSFPPCAFVADVVPAELALLCHLNRIRKAVFCSIYCAIVVYRPKGIARSSAMPARTR